MTRRHRGGAHLRRQYRLRGAARLRVRGDPAVHADGRLPRQMRRGARSLRARQPTASAGCPAGSRSRPSSPTRCSRFVTGVSIAAAAAFSRIAYPEMRRYGYEREFALGCIAGCACLGMLIPPSVLMIVWGVLTELSIGKLFLAGVIPGLLADRRHDLHLCGGRRHHSTRSWSAAAAARRSRGRRSARLWRSRSQSSSRTMRRRSIGACCRAPSLVVAAHHRLLGVDLARALYADRGRRCRRRRRADPRHDQGHQPARGLAGGPRRRPHRPARCCCCCSARSSIRACCR